MRSLSLVMLVSSLAFITYPVSAALRSSTAAEPETTANTVNPATTTPSTELPYFASSPDFAGNGCKANTNALIFQPHQQSFSLTLPPMEVGTQAGQARRVVCNLVMPVSVPDGYQVALLPLSFTGTIQGATLQVELRREYFFAGSMNTPLTDTLDTQTTRVSDSFSDDNQWAKCGESVNLRANISLRVMQGEGLAQISLHSTDAQQPTVFSLVYRACY